MDLCFVLVRPELLLRTTGYVAQPAKKIGSQKRKELSVAACLPLRIWPRKRCPEDSSGRQSRKVPSISNNTQESLSPLRGNAGIAWSIGERQTGSRSNQRVVDLLAF